MGRRGRVLGAVAMAVVLGACTESGATEYSEDVRDSFVSACTDAGGNEETCGCAYESISSEVEFERFRQIEEDLEDGGEVPPEISDLFAECAAAGPRPTNATETTPSTADE